LEIEENLEINKRIYKQTKGNWVNGKPSGKVAITEKINGRGTFFNGVLQNNERVFG
jgi:hypothetical protein